jgi:hypothetical protein
MMAQAADLLTTTTNPAEDQIRTAMKREPLPPRDLSKNPDRDPAGANVMTREGA